MFDFDKWKEEMGDSWNSPESMKEALRNNFSGKWSELPNDFRILIIKRVKLLWLQDEKERFNRLTRSNIPVKYFSGSDDFAGKVKAIEDAMPFLLIKGEHDSKKTEAICNYVVKNIENNSFYYTTSGQFCADCLANESIFENAKDIDIFILDDLGIENVSNWDRNYIMEVMKYRMDNDLPFVFITALEEDEIKKKYPVIFSYCRTKKINILQFVRSL